MRKPILTLLTLFILVITPLFGCTTEQEATATLEPTSAPAEPTEPPAEPTEPPAAEPTEAPPTAGDGAKLILATTTSTEDSGLLEFILPDFEEQYGVEIDVIAVGTGQALTLGEDGNADVLLVHARAREDAFMDAGHGVRREDVMYNDFVIAGPPDDPAGLRGMTSAADAFKKIAEAESTFISRGDESGTHSKELSVWEGAGIEPAGDWYISAGQGMGEVLTMADEQQGYTLSDRATYLARTLEGTDLEILVEGDPILFNPYGVIAVNPDKGEHIQIDLANTFIDWLVSLPVQEKIGQFGAEKFGAPLFTPDSAAWRAEHGSSAQPVEGEVASGDVALKVTGTVGQEMAWSEAEVKALEAIDVESTNKDGETSTYTGVPLKTLLDLAGVQADATTIVFVADDGYTAEIALSEVQACDNCIVSFRNQGGFSTVLPDFPGSLQVKGVIEINVK